MKSTSALFGLLALLAGPAAAADAPKPTAASAAEPLALDRARTAILIMDYENDIVGMLAAEVQAPLLERAGAILKEARRAGLPVIYVVVRFRDGYPEVNPHNKLFASLKQSGRMREGTHGVEIDARVAPVAGDVVVAKSRVGAFSTTDMETILRAKGVSTLVLMGISTSGVVLSTVRWAADMDYQIVVVGDACADRDAEVQRVLTEKVFPWQATVVNTTEMVKALGKL